MVRYGRAVSLCAIAALVLAAVAVSLARRVATPAPSVGGAGELRYYLLVVGLAFGASALLIAVRWPGLRGGTAYTLLATSLALQFTVGSSGRADALDRVFEWVDVLAGALAPALLFHVAVALTKRTLPRRWLSLGLAYGTSALIVASWLLALPAGGTTHGFATPERLLERIDRSSYLALSIAVVASTVLLLRSYTQSSSALHRGQMRWLLWGLMLGLGPFVVLYAVPWAFEAAQPPRWAQFLAVTPMLFVPAAFTAAMARYRLHDVDLLLLRGVTEVAALLATGAVYAAATFVLREGLSELVPMSRSATRYTGFLLAAIGYPQLRLWVRAGVDRALYKQRYSYRATLLDWARELNAETDLCSLLASLERRVCDTLGVSRASILTRTGRMRFESGGADAPATVVEFDDATAGQLEAEPWVQLEPGGVPTLAWARYLFSMKVKGALRAVLVVSGREEGDQPLTSEDRALLVTLSAQAATAIEAARLVREVRRRAEEIEQLHTRQARILDNSAVGLALVDGGWRILAWNRALEQIYGLRQAEAIGRRLSEVFPLHVARKIEREASLARTAEGSRIFRLTMIERGGSRIVVNVTISPSEDELADEERCRVITIDDVTARVRLEEQVLQQERLASLGLLAAGVAHEINTPLTGISSYAELLVEELAAGDPRRETLRKILAQSRRASTIANSLLTLARPERTRFEEIDLNDTVREALQLFEPQIRGRDVKLQARLDPAQPRVRGHRGKLQQVLLNLLLNARDAVDDGGEIVVNSYRLDDRVMLEVADDGQGIAEEDLPRIFDPFFTTKGRGNGTGLGLSITYGIVQEHAGRIEVDSVPGRLTRFRIALPAAVPVRMIAR
jgi:PAS domain S-box-containing protein